MGDFDIGMKSKSLGYDKLDEFCDLFNLTNLLYKKSWIPYRFIFNKYTFVFSKNTRKWDRIKWLSQTNNNLLQD